MCYYMVPQDLVKQRLAVVIANEMGVNVRTTSGPAIERPGDLAAILTSLRAWRSFIYR